MTQSLFIRLEPTTLDLSRKISEKHTSVYLVFSHNAPAATARRLTLVITASLRLLFIHPELVQQTRFS